MNIILIFFLFVFCLWLIGFFLVNDPSVPSVSPKTKNILAIFPHPDDESLTVGGLLSQLSFQKIQTNLLVLTQGGAGESNLIHGQDLKKTRTKEMKNSASILGVTNLIQADFTDGRIREEEGKVIKFIDSQISNLKPDLIITYDLAGLYGHEDHMTTSSIVTKLIKDKYPNITLWYTSLPKKVFKLANLPVDMAKDKDFASKRATPNLKVFIGLNFINRIKSVHAHHSQSNSFRKGIPAILPLWFVYSLMPFDYFHRVN